MYFTCHVFNYAFQILVFQLLDNSANKHAEEPRFFSCCTSGSCSLAKFTKLCLVWQPNIRNTLRVFGRGALSPEPPTKGSAPGPSWGICVSQTPCAHLRNCCLLVTNVRSAETVEPIGCDAESYVLRMLWCMLA